MLNRHGIELMVVMRQSWCGGNLIVAAAQANEKHIDKILSALLGCYLMLRKFKHPHNFVLETSDRACGV